MASKRCAQMHEIRGIEQFPCYPLKHSNLQQMSDKQTETEPLDGSAQQREALVLSHQSGHAEPPPLPNACPRKQAFATRTYVPNDTQAAHPPMSP